MQTDMNRDTFVADQAVQCNSSLILHKNNELTLVYCQQMYCFSSVQTYRIHHPLDTSYLEVGDKTFFKKLRQAEI